MVEVDENPLLPRCNDLCHLACDEAANGTF